MKILSYFSTALMVWVALTSCDGTLSTAPAPSPTPTPSPSPDLQVEVGEVDDVPETSEDRVDEAEQALAHVISVEVSGEAGQYQFRVEVSSEELGCEQYAAPDVPPKLWRYQRSSPSAEYKSP